MAEQIKILDSLGNELLETTVNVGVSVAPSKTFAKHTLENSRIVIDDQYDNPTMLTLRIILDPADYVDTYKRIARYYKDITSFTIQTKTDVYRNMYLESIPHEEVPEMFNTIGINLEFTEQLIQPVITSKISSSQAASQSDVSSVESGNKSKSGTVAKRIADSFSRYISGDE